MSVTAPIRFLFEQYYDVQKLRIAAFNGIVAIVGASQKIIETPEDASQEKHEPQVQFADKPSLLAKQIIAGKVKPSKDLGDLVWYHNSLLETEKNLAKRLDAWSSHHPLRINYLSKIMGIGPIFSSGLIAWLSPISRFPNISKLWAYCGLSSEHYQCQCAKKHKMLSSHKLEKCPVRVGKKRTMCNAQIVQCEFVKAPMKRKYGWIMLANQRMKTFMWKIASSFEKQKAAKSKYRRIYDERKQKELKNPFLKKAIDDKVAGAKLHVRLRAMRYTEKHFLSDLWLTWRKLEGLPVTKPYPNSMMDHTGFEEPETDKE